MTHTQVGTIYYFLNHYGSQVIKIAISIIQSASQSVSQSVSNCTWDKVFDNDITFHDKFLDDVDAKRVLNVDCDGQFVAIDG